ncbi:Uncharacterised protein [Halioglobus japonicus]|nr:Uncharacterised protein [Halioglobus japonicus]
MTNSKPNNSNRMVLLLIGGIPLTVILAASWLWFFVVNGDIDLVGALGTANRGTLVQPPRQLDDQALLDQSGASVKVTEMEPRWTMIIPAAGGRCGKDCEETLYLTRQIHVAMGKEFNRIRRLYVSDHAVRDTQFSVAQLSDGDPAPADFVQYLSTQHKGLEALTLSPAAYATLFPEHGANADTWYLMDPAGWIMMSYNDQVSYKDVIADLKFLLKNSGG